MKLGDLQQLISGDGASVQVINFWATWCGPCVKELPYFEKLNAENRPGVRVTLVSMDLDLDPNPAKVNAFIKRRGLRSEVLLLDAQDPNAYIDKIDGRWSGALPATLIVDHKTGERVFIERSLHEGELEELLNRFL